MFSAKIGLENNGRANYVGGMHVWFPWNKALAMGATAFLDTGGHGALPPLSPPISLTAAHAELQWEVVAPPVVLGTHNGDTCDVPQLYEVCLALCLSTCPPTQPRAQVFTQHGVDFGAFLDAAGVVGTVDTLTCLNSLNWDVVQCAPPHSLCVSLATASLLALSEWQVAVHEGGWHSAGRTEAQQLLARASVGGAAG